MAGILERCRDIMASNVHALLDKCEDPEKMLDQELRKAAKQLAEIKEATASGITTTRSVPLTPSTPARPMP